MIQESITNLNNIINIRTRYYTDVTIKSSDYFIEFKLLYLDKIYTTEDFLMLSLNNKKIKLRLKEDTVITYITNEPPEDKLKKRRY